MIIEFSVANFRSVYERCIFSMEAEECRNRHDNEIESFGTTKLLRTAGLYGANSSGKSNILKAMAFMRFFVLNSSKINEGDTLFYEPFALHQRKNEPTLLEITFIHNDYIYRYGFEYNSLKIIKEWLTKTSVENDSSEISLFNRTEDGIECNDADFAEGIGKEEMTRSNRLFVSVCSQLNGKESNILIKWLNESVNLVSGSNDFLYGDFTKKMLLADKHKVREDIKRYFTELQLGFDDIIAQINEDSNTINLQSIHNIYNDQGEVISQKSFNFDEMESEGTRKLVHLLGPIIDTLQKGWVLIIDEIDAKLHPIISRYVIQLFNNPEANKDGAQLIFATHDTDLLSSVLQYPDQIWFTEKNHLEQTELYSLSDINTPDGALEHKKEKFEQNYIAGRYGAIPYIINK